MPKRGGRREGGKSSQKGNSSLAPEGHPRHRGMRVIAVRTLREFWEQHADAEQALKAWYAEATTSLWPELADIKARYPSADVLPGNRVVFNIKGNHYRLIVKIHYNRAIVYIRFVGTHAEYERIYATAV